MSQRAAAKAPCDYHQHEGDHSEGTMAWQVDLAWGYGGFLRLMHILCGLLSNVITAAGHVGTQT